MQHGVFSLVLLDFFRTASNNKHKSISSPRILLPFQSDFPLLLLGRGRQHSPKDIVPHLAGNAETELKVLVMMSEVVSLHFTKISWETGVVKCIVAWTRHSLDEAPQI